MLVIGALFHSNRVNAAAITGGVLVSISAYANAINPILQALVSIVTIGVGITAILLSIKNLRKMKDDDS